MARATASGKGTRQGKETQRTKEKGTTQKIVLDYAPRHEQHLLHEGADKHRFSLVVAHRRFGKTLAAILHLIKVIMLCTKPNARGAYIAPYRHQAKSIAWDYLKAFTRAIPGVTYNEAELSCDLPGGRRIRLFGADNPNALRGLYFDYVVMDEVAQMRPETFGEVIRPTLMDRKGGCMFIGTPMGINMFHELYLKGLKLKDWYVGVFRASDTGIISQDELDVARSIMSDAQFRQEMECDFTASSDNTFITLDIILPCRDKYIHPSAWSKQPKVLGVDVAGMGADSTVLAKRQGRHLHDLVKMKGETDTFAVANRVAHEIKNWKPNAVFIDGGFNPGVIDTLRQWGFKVTQVMFGSNAMNKDEFENLRVEMWDKTRLWLAGGASIPADEELIGDLAAPTFKYSKRGLKMLESKADMKGKRGLRSPDKGDALALTFAAPVTTRDIIVEGNQVIEGSFDTYEELALPGRGRRIM
ncbi:MAG: terminase [Deltaproteobacteria bacterium]|nr:terminase [Deltaproteobacteria bacterium]